MIDMATKVSVKNGEDRYTFKGQNVEAKVNKEGHLIITDGTRRLGMFRYWDCVVDISGDTEIEAPKSK